jgi:hypothetical protein
MGEISIRKETLCSGVGVEAVLRKRDLAEPTDLPAYADGNLLNDMQSGPGGLRSRDGRRCRRPHGPRI